MALWYFVTCYPIDGSEKPIALKSKTQENGSLIQKEAFAIYYVETSFYFFLYGQRYTKDYKPLTSIFGSKTGVTEVAATHLEF